MSDVMVVDKDRRLLWRTDEGLVLGSKYSPRKQIPRRCLAKRRQGETSGANFRRTLPNKRVSPARLLRVTHIPTTRPGAPGGHPTTRHPSDCCARRYWTPSQARSSNEPRTCKILRWEASRPLPTTIRSRASPPRSIFPRHPQRRSSRPLGHKATYNNTQQPLGLLQHGESYHDLLGHLLGHGWLVSDPGLLALMSWRTANTIFTRSPVWLRQRNHLVHPGPETLPGVLRRPHPR